MKVLFINPPLIPISEICPPVGLCTLAYWIKDKHEVKILDLDLDVKKTSMEPRKFMFAAMLEAIQQFNPQVIGFTSMYNNSLQAEMLIRKAKAAFPDIYTVAGGAHFGAQGKDALRRISHLDFVIEGEGELGLEGLLDFLANKIPVNKVPNLCYRNGSEIISNTRAPLINLGRIEPIWPALESVINLSEYASTIQPDSKRRAIYIEAGRGCPFNCTFCAPAQFWERKYRVKSAAAIVGEMRYLQERHQYDSFLLIHDLLTADKTYVKELSAAILHSGLKIEWMANARIDLDLNDVLPVMKESGCWKLFYGIESASEHIQKEVKKGLLKKDIIDSISHVSASGIDSTCSFIIGFANETPEELSETIALGSQLKLIGAETVQYHRLRFFPPAPMSEANLKKGFDMETLKLEFPFQHITEEEINTIKSSETFYSGYFAPESLAGEAHQLSQIELFFQQAVSTAPVTISAIAAVAGEKLVQLFYRSLTDIGPIDRYSIDWVSNDMLVHWKVILPYLNYFCKKATTDKGLRKILGAIIKYEEIRLNIVVGKNWKIKGADFAADGCTIFTLPVNIFDVINRLKKNEPVSELEPEDTPIK
jgi:radical SAM superfamily enzyme YgiQ (UPF0313 family)